MWVENEGQQRRWAMPTLRDCVFYGAGEVITTAGLEGTMSAVGIHAIAGATAGGINSVIAGNGGNMDRGMLIGAISAGIGECAGGYGGLLAEDDLVSELAGRTALGGVTGGITAEIYGNDFGQGFRMGARTAAYAYIFNHGFHEWTREKIEQDRIASKRAAEKRMRAQNQRQATAEVRAVLAARPSQQSLRTTSDGAWVAAAGAAFVPADGPVGEIVFGGIAVGASALEILIYSGTSSQDLSMEAIKQVTNLPAGPYAPFINRGKDIVIDRIPR